MYYVYVLQSLKDKEFYTGFTTDLEKRLEEHNRGYETSTSSRVPFQIIYFECSLNKQDAIARERYLKSGMGKKYIRNRIKNFLKFKI